MYEEANRDGKYFTHSIEFASDGDRLNALRNGPIATLLQIKAKAWSSETLMYL